VTTKTKRKKKEPRRYKHLPHVPSRLIDITIRDLQRAAADPNVTLNMGTWLQWNRTDGTCETCAAGAVMLYGMEVPRHGSVRPFYFSAHNTRALYAINTFRLGLVDKGCDFLGVKNSNVKDRAMTRYDGTPTSLKALLWDLRCLADEFRAEGN
jgi:hypothetical protein